MIILGLDPGIARTGYGILDTREPQLFISCGCLTTKPSSEIDHRLWQIGQDLLSIITKYKPDIAVVEQVFFGTNTTTAILTAQVRGIIIYLLRHHHIKTTTLTPLQIKSQLTGYGQADKKQVQSIIQKRLHLSQTPQPDDTADALAAALCIVDNKYQIPNIST